MILWEIYLALLLKLKIHASLDPKILLLGIHLMEIKQFVHKNIYRNDNNNVISSGDKLEISWISWIEQWLNYDISILWNICIYLEEWMSRCCRWGGGFLPGIVEWDNEDAEEYV